MQELDRISLYERQKRAVLIRNIVIEKTKVYDHNPAYKRFLKDLDSKTEMKTKDKKEKGEL